MRYGGLRREIAVLLGMLVAASLSSEAAFALDPKKAITQYALDRWTTDDGLPQNSVNAILQTRVGYLWLATFDGLVRFDGMQFTVFNKSNTKGIGGNRFDTLYEDRHGALWAGTEDSRLIRYQAGVFTTYTPKDGWPSSPLIQIEEDEAGDFQVVSRNEVAKWKDGRFITYRLEDLLPESVGAKWVGGNRLAWTGANGLSWYSRGRLNTYSIESGLPSLNLALVTVFEDHYGTVWIVTRDGGLVRVKDGHFAVCPVKDRRLQQVRAQEDRKGNIWLALVDEQLGRFKDGRLALYNASSGFPETTAMCFYEDHEGNFWIGTSKGLLRAREAAITVYTRQQGLSSDNVYSIYEDRAGGLWFGTWGSGVTRLKDGRSTHYAMKDGLGTGFITALYEDRDGHMWIGTGIGLHRFKDGRLSALPDSDGFFSEGAWAIHQDRAGRFWFGTGKGLIKLEGGRYTRYTTADGLAGDDVKVILEDRAGHLWFGTWGGLTRFGEGQFTSYTEQDGLASDHIRTLYEDADETLWIGTYDGGLGRFKDGRFTRYTTKDGLFNNGVFQILEDERGYFWMSCNKGIYRVARQELDDFADGRSRSITSIAYGRNDGLLNVECNGGRQPAGWKTSDGRLWFPTAQGAAVIDPSRIELNQEPPPVVIEEFRLNNRAVPFSETIEISPDRNNNLEIRYQALSFIRPEQQRYRYQMAGIDDDWIEAGSRRAAYYGHLPPGKYAFTVIAANSDGVWNMTGASIRMIVIPPFYRTWWFLTLIGLSLAGLAIFSYQLRISRLQRANAAQEAFSQRLLESQESERKRIADELHASLGQLVSLISRYAKDGKEKPGNHSLATELFGKIFAAAREANKETHRIAYNLRPPELDTLGLTEALRSLVGQFELLPEIKFLGEIDDIDSAFDDDGKVHVYRIAQESLNNVVRHAEATRVRFVIKRDTRTVRFEIQDDGRGFNAAANSLASVNRPGLGLHGVKERARLLGGKTEILSAPGQGTRIIMTFEVSEEKS